LGAPKKETFRRGREGFFLFRGLSWSRGPKRLEVVCRYRRFVPRAGVKSRKRYFFFDDFFVVDFLPDFFELAFFVAMALTSFLV
jgi:hypothetical protein